MKTDKWLDQIFDKEFLVTTEAYMAEDERTHQRRKYTGDEEVIKQAKAQILKAIKKKIRAIEILEPYDTPEQFIGLLYEALGIEELKGGT